jgi:hypothetical protein
MPMFERLRLHELAAVTSAIHYALWWIQHNPRHVKVNRDDLGGTLLSEIEQREEALLSDIAPDRLAEYVEALSYELVLAGERSIPVEVRARARSLGLDLAKGLPPSTVAISEQSGEEDAGTGSQKRTAPRGYLPTSGLSGHRRKATFGRARGGARAAGGGRSRAMMRRRAAGGRAKATRRVAAGARAKASRGGSRGRGIVRSRSARTGARAGGRRRSRGRRRRS